MSEKEDVAGWKMSELENDEVGKCRSWQASELDFEVDRFIDNMLQQHNLLGNPPMSNEKVG